MKRFLALLLISALVFPGNLAMANPNTKEYRDLDAKKLLKSELVKDVSQKLLADWVRTNYASNEPGLYELQFTGPVKREWKQALEKSGVILGDYLPDYAFVAKIKAKDVDKLKNMPGVRSIELFQPQTKMGAWLEKKGETLTGVLAKNQETEIAVNLFSANEAKDFHVTLGKLGGKVVKDNGKELTVRLPGDKLRALAFQNDVVAIDQAPKFKLFNDQAAGITKVASAGWNTGLTGAGQVIGVADTGLDTGVNGSSLHPDLQGRVQQIFAVGRAGNASDTNGHGTHVAGSIVGAGTASQGKIKGMASGAKLVFQSIMDSTGNLAPVALRSLFDQAWQAGARIHSDSWGTDARGAYNSTAREVDQFIWDKDMTVLFAAGNFGDLNRDGVTDYGTIASPGTAKNAITVGASENYRPDKGAMADNKNQIASFSSRGNTKDGRIKPDIVAPGSWILSTKSSRAPGSNFWSTVNQYYGYMGGTSMATPITAGTVGLMRQYFMDTLGVTPKPSMLKAALINGATDLSLPRRDQGWGRVNLENAIMNQDRQDLWYENESVKLSTGQNKAYNLSVKSTTKPLTLSLVWTDYPGSTVAAKSLVNDLDVTIQAPSGTIYNGNDSTMPFNTERDRLNNVEKIVIPKPEVGVYKVTVAGFNVPVGPQDYSIVATADLGTATNSQPAPTPTSPQPTNPTVPQPTNPTETQPAPIKPNPTPEPPAQDAGTTAVNWSYTWTGSLSSGSKKASYVDVAAPGTLTANLAWPGSADLDLYLYDQSNRLVAKSEGAVNGEKITFSVKTSGRYYFSVASYSGGASYTLTAKVPTNKSIMKRTGLSGSLNNTDNRNKSVTFNVTASGAINLMLKWGNTAADVDVYLYNSSGQIVAKATSGKLNPETISYVVTTPGQYRLRIYGYAGTADYQGSITYPIK